MTSASAHIDYLISSRLFLPLAREDEGRSLTLASESQAWHFTEQVRGGLVQITLLGTLTNARGPPAPDSTFHASGCLADGGSGT